MATLAQFRRLAAVPKIHQLCPMISAKNCTSHKEFKSGLNCARTVGISTSNTTNYHRRFDTRSIHTSAMLTTKVASVDDQLVTGGKMKVSTYLTLLQAPEKSLNTQNNNPLLLFFPWLGATSSAIGKYCELYHQKGWDVLIVNANAKQFLWPPNAKELAHDVLDYVMSKKVLEERTDFIVHSMSIGAFIYTVLFIELQQQPEKYIDFRNKLRGQIFDSIVIGGLKRMGKGMAASFTPNALGQIYIRGLTALYLLLTKKYTTDYYDYSVKFFHDSPITIPTLFYYSLDDEFSDPNAMENVIGTWRAEHPKMDVTYKCWSKSIHTGHLRLHRNDYIAELTHFLTKIELIDDTVHVRSNL